MKKSAVLILIGGLLLMIAGCGAEKDAGSLQVSNDVDFGKSDYNTIVSPNNKLGFDLLEEVEPNENGNTFISPTSLLMALSMVYNGADGDTKEEMADVLHAKGIRAEELNKANASLMSMLDSKADDIQLHVANSMWLNKNFHFQDDFSESNEDYFNAKIKEIDVGDDASANEINDWVKKSTNDKIDTMVDPPLNPNLVAMLINAIYFNGEWTHPFDPEQTEDQSFHLKDGKTKDVPFMKLDQELPYIENDDFQAISLPYGEDGDMSMKVFLPDENADLEDFQKKFTQENWEQWLDEFYETDGDLWLPKFQSEYEVTLNDTLKELGMTSAFDDGAGFSKIVEEREQLKISEVKQKTFLDVNEKGTEAAASTSVEIEETAAMDSFTMKVDRPFMIVIHDEKTNAILFMGMIADPQKEE